MALYPCNGIPLSNPDSIIDANQTGGKGLVFVAAEIGVLSDALRFSDLRGAMQGLVYGLPASRILYGTDFFVFLNRSPASRLLRASGSLLMFVVWL